MPIIEKYKGISPKIGSNVFIAENAVIIGDVTIGDNSSIWYGCVIRGDVEKVCIGSGTNIQDGTIIHTSRFQGPTIIGDNVTVGHQCLLHACIIDSHAFVGMGAKVIDFAHMQSYSMLGAGSLLTQNKVIKTGQLFVGSPARYMRELSAEEKEYIETSANNYVLLAAEYID